MLSWHSLCIPILDSSGGDVVRILVLLSILLLICPTSGFSTTFQDSDYSDYVVCTSTACGFYDSTTGGNDYYNLGSRQYIRNLVAQMTTYAAISEIGISGGSAYKAIYVYNAAGGLIGGKTYSITPVPARLEVIVEGNKINFYCNDALIDSYTTTVNPSYVSFGDVPYYGDNIYYDDFVYGASESPYIFSVAGDDYFLKKDLTDPANSGLARRLDGTVVNSNNMTSTWGKPSTEIQTVNFVNYQTGHVYCSKDTTAGYGAGTISWPLADCLFNSGAPYGYYAITIAGTGAYSKLIPYMGAGATVSFDSDGYALKDTAKINYTVWGEGYWDPNTYAYKLIVTDAFGEELTSLDLTAQSGEKSVNFPDGTSPGVYYAVLEAIPRAGGEVIWMNYDYAELQSYVRFSGYVMNGETGLPISASLNISQGSTYQDVSASAGSGWASSNSWLTGSQISIRTTATGYDPDLRVFTPAIARTIPLNITMLPVDKAHVGVSVGGVVRDGVYGNPVVNATYYVRNNTIYSSITNIAGYARVDNLEVGKLYDVWGSKLGYEDSQVWQVVGVGS